MTAGRVTPAGLRVHGRERGVQLLLRTLILLSALLAVALIRAAAAQPILALDLVVVGLALMGVVLPDNHLGLAVVVMVGVNWLAAVDDPSTPWSIGVAVSLAMFHTSMAAASVAPMAARWTPAMRRRWTRRFLVVAVASFPTWVLVALIDRSEVASSPALLTAAWFTLAVVGLWARHGHFGVDSPH